MEGFHGVFKVTIDQAKASPHTKLLHRGGVLWQEIDDNAECFVDCYLTQHEKIVNRAMRLDHESVCQIQCAECTKRYGPCDAPNCFFNSERRKLF